MFGDGPKAIKPYDPYEQNTPLCSELELIKEFAHGDLELWDNMPWAVRRMWLYFRVLQDEKRRRHEEKVVQEAEHNRRVMADMPKERADRPGVRY